MTDAPASLGARIRSGVLWKGASQLTLQLSRVVVALVLARLLAPEDWGVAAMVLLFSSFAVVITDSALGTALIQRRTIDETDRSTVFWTSAGFGLVLMLVGFWLASPVARFYGEPEVRDLFVAVCVGCFVSALGSTHMALLARDLRFRLLELRQITATVVGSVTGIGLAVAGYGPVAIVGLSLAEAFTSTAVLWLVSPWRPRRVFAFASLRRLAGFTANVFGENVVYQASRNLPGLLIGRVLGSAPLGTFTIATNVILVPFTRLAAPLQQVFFPAFSQIAEERERIGDLWLRATRLVALVSAPALVGLVVVADDFVAVVLGDRWAGAVTLIQILAWVGLVQSLQTLHGEILMAVGRAGQLFAFSIVWLVGSVGAVVVGLQWGIVGVACAYAVATLAVEPLRTLLVTRALGMPFLDAFRPLAGVAQAAALMGLVLVAARALLVAQGVPEPVRLLLLIVVGGGVYAAACLWRAPDALAELRGGLRRRRDARPSVVPREEPVYPNG